AVREKSARMRVHSPTGASSDIYRTYNRDLRALENAFPAQPGQCGAVLGIGKDLCLDTVSRPDAFARLWPKLRAGYLLDALDRLDQPAATSAGMAEFVAALSEASVTRRPSAGRGDDIRVSGRQILGSGLDLNGELLERFPKAAWPQMSLEEYALGQRDHPENFCRWMEFRAKDLGSMKGGSARKTHIYRQSDGEWWLEKNRYATVEEAWEAVRAG